MQSIVEAKFRARHVCLNSQAESRLWQLMALLFLYYGNFCTKTDTGDKTKYSSIPKNTETQQKNTRENTKKPLGLIKIGFLINTSDGM